MNAPGIVVRRHPYEEPYHVHVQFVVSNGSFSDDIDIYCNTDDIADIGRAMKRFPTKIGDEYRYEYGSEDPAELVLSLFSATRAYD